MTSAPRAASGMLGTLRTRLFGQTAPPPPKADPVIERIKSGDAVTIKPKTKMVDQVLAYHKQAYPEDYGVIIQDEGIYLAIMQIVIDRKMKKTAGKLRLEPIPCTLAATRSQPVVINTKAGRKLEYRDASGAFRIHIGHGQVCHLIRCRLGKGIAKEYVVGTNETIRALWMLLKTGAKNAIVSLPKKGCWETYTWDQRTAFKKWKLQEDHVAHFRNHPQYDELADDVGAFFGDIDQYTRYGQTGMRKVLMTGPPGSGKTSIAMALAVRLAETMPVIYTSSDHFRNVATMAANLKRPCLIVIEEMDTLIRPSGDDLNFLDGMTTPRNVSGTYLLSTTNYPKRIDPRILKRPGRLDKVMRVPVLRTKAAASVARTFLPPDVTLSAADDKRLFAIFDRTTPAEIREIVGIAVRMCRPTARNKEPPVFNADLMAAARSELKLSMAKAEIEEDPSPEEREFLHETVGPIDNDDLMFGGFDDGPVPLENTVSEVVGGWKKGK